MPSFSYIWCIVLSLKNKAFTVKNKANDKPMLVLISGIKGGKVGNDILPDLVLKNDDNSDTAEISDIYKIMRGKING